MNRERLNELGGIILDAAITVHKELGPGLLEFALARELELKDISIKKQLPVELFYKQQPLGKAYVIDILVENQIIIEVKSADIHHPVFDAQLITYLKLADKKLGT